MAHRTWWFYGVGGTVAAVVLGALTIAAVLISTWFVILYAKVGPIPGQKVVRPVDDMGGLVGPQPTHPAP
jgi:hypothetical protein